MEFARTVFMIVLGFWARVSHRTCIDQNESSIVRQIEAGQAEHGVPSPVLAVVAYLESHYGCDPRSRGSWGVPWRFQGNYSGTQGNITARSLATGFRRCGSWEGAISRFRCGSCTTCPNDGGYTPAEAITLVRRVYSVSREPVPDHLRRSRFATR